MTVGTESHTTGHSSGMTTTTVAAVKDSTGNTRELYVLLDTGCSHSEKKSYRLSFLVEHIRTVKFFSVSRKKSILL